MPQWIWIIPRALSPLIAILCNVNGWAQLPRIDRIVNAADFGVSSGEGVTPGSLVSIFGLDLAQGPASSGSPLPFSLNSVSLTFDGARAALLYVSPAQINAQVPWSLTATGSRTAQVIVNREGRASAPFIVPVTAASPAIFTFRSGSGPAVAVNADGKVTQPVGSLLGIATQPAKPGSFVSLFATGLGSVDAPIADGENSSDRLRRTAIKPVVLIGGSDSPVVFAGLAPGFAGVYQINCIVPQGVRTGDAVPVQLRIGSVVTTNSATIALEAPDLEFLTPWSGKRVAGENVFVAVAERAGGLVERNTTIEFDVSTDGLTFLPLGTITAPDFGPGVFTTAFDSTAFPIGPLFLRARYGNEAAGPIIQVAIARLPIANCSVRQVQVGELQFDCSTSRSETGAIVEYRWDFGDGTGITNGIPIMTHRYPGAGEFPFEVTVVDNHGFTSTFLRSILFLPPFLLTQDRESCGCDQLVVTATGTSALGDIRRRNDRGTPNDPSDDTLDPAPLGPDPTYLTFNFDVTAILTPGSNPALCTEGQQVRSTRTAGGVTGHKKACTAGLERAICTQNSDCETRTCAGGVRDGQPCNTANERSACIIGAGQCRGDGNGVCTDFPLAGPNRGNDDYSRDFPGDNGPKVHCPKCKSPTWFDAPGSHVRRADTGVDFRYDADFLIFVRGGAGACSCHIRIVIDWDGTNKVLRPATDITRVDDGESVRCTLVK